MASSETTTYGESYNISVKERKISYYNYLLNSLIYDFLANLWIIYILA